MTVLDAARAAGGVPVVYASSAAVYGNLGDEVAREDGRTAPLTAYGADKLGAELHAAVALHVHGVPSVGLRFFNVYGPREQHKGAMSSTAFHFNQQIIKDQSEQPTLNE